jgi:hypothetical protein
MLRVIQTSDRHLQLTAAPYRLHTSRSYIIYNAQITLQGRGGWKTISVHDVAFLIILGSRQTKRELCKMDLKNWSIRFPVIKAVFCKKN